MALTGILSLRAEWFRRDFRRRGAGLAARRVIASEERIVRFNEIVKGGDSLCEGAKVLANVEVLRELTISLEQPDGTGKFESLRVGVRIGMPVPVGSIEDVRTAMEDHAEDVVCAQRDRVKGSDDAVARWVLRGLLRESDFSPERWRIVLARVEVIRHQLATGGA